jgi:hypothetical protein
MFWHASITSQRPAPRGEAVMTCAGRSSFLTLSTMNHEHQRWRG